MVCFRGLANRKKFGDIDDNKKEKFGFANGGPSENLPGPVALVMEMKRW